MQYGLLFAILATVVQYSDRDVARQDHFVSSSPDIRVFVRELRPKQGHRRELPPVLLVHGARVPGVASFDLPISNGSLAADFAREGFTVFVMDVRGYGASTRPLEMSLPPDENNPLVRTPVAAQDIAAVVKFVKKRTEARLVAIMGWATGGQWAGYYASLHPDDVSHLVLYNSLYGGSSDHATIGHGSGLEDKTAPGRFDFQSYGAYRFSTADSLFRPCDNSIPIADKTEWRDPLITDAYARLALSSDPTSNTRTPPSFRSPTGAYEDSFYLATGRQLWDGSTIRAATLIIRSERDFWSRPADADALERHLVHAARVHRLTIPDATHCVHLDRPQFGRDVLLRAVVKFLRNE